MKQNIIIALAAIAIFVVYTISIYGKGQKDEREDWQSKWNDQIALHEKAIAAAQAAEHEKEIQWLKDFEKVKNDAQATVNRMATDLANSNDSGNRLRNQVARLAANARKECGNSGATEGGNTARSSADMLAELSTGIDEAAREIAGFADKSRAAGIACQDSFGVIKNQR